MRRHLVAVLAVAAIGALGLFVGGCSSGCGHCEDCGYAEEVCHDGCGECAPVECEPCGNCLDVWYECPCCGTTSAYDGGCTHCDRHLEVRHAGVSVSPQGVAGPRSGGYGWQIEIAQRERSIVQAQAAARSHSCPECGKKAAPPKHADCAECAKKAAPPQHADCAECAKKAQPQRRTVVREKPVPKPMSTRKASAKPAAGD